MYIKINESIQIILGLYGYLQKCTFARICKLVNLMRIYNVLYMRRKTEGILHKIERKFIICACIYMNIS